MNKKLKMIIGVFLFIILIFIILIILPFVIDLNKFKPQIQNFVAQNINAKLDFSSAKLTIFSGLGVELHDVDLENTDSKFSGNKLLQVKELKFKTELFPLIKGNFIGEVEVKGPEVFILKDGNKNNILSLFKTSKNIDAPSQLKNTNIDAPTLEIQKTKKSIKEVSSIEQKEKNINSSSFTDRILVKSFIIENANLTFKDKNGNVKNDLFLVHNLNMNITNIGINKNVKIILSTDLNTKNDDFEVNGPVTLDLIVNTKLENNMWKDSIFNGELNLDKFYINFRNAFVKSNKIPFKVVFQGIVNPDSILMDDFKLNLQNLNAKARVTIQDFQKLNSNISLNLSTNNVSALREIFPQHQKLLSHGNFDLKAFVQGMLTQKDSIKSNLSLKAKLFESDFNLNFIENSIHPLKGSVKLESKSLNLSELLKPFLAKDSTAIEIKSEQSNVQNTTIPATTPGQSEKPVQTATENSNNVVYSSKDFSLSEKQKKQLAGSDLLMDVNIGKFIYENLNFSNLELNAHIKNYTASFNKLNMNLFHGFISSNLIVDLGVQPISFDGSINLKNIQIQELVKFINPDKGSPLEGNSDLNTIFNGKGTTRHTLSKTLNAKGTFLFHEGKLNNKNLITLASEQLGKYVSNIAIPGIKFDQNSLNKIDLGANNKRNLDNLKGDFEIKNGKLLLRNSILSEQGDMKLNVDVGLDESLSGTATYIANAKIREQLVAQDKNFSYIFDEKGNFILNLILSGTITNPNVEVDTKLLQDNLMKNSAKQLKNRIQEEISKNPQVKKIQEEINKNPQVKKIEEDAKKLLKDKGIDLNKFGF